MHRITITLAALTLAVPAQVIAQETNAADAGYATTEREDDDGFPMGLLGLLGLAGLLGLKRREPDIHVDARRGTGTTGGTGGTDRR